VYTGFLIRCQDGVDLIGICYYTSKINQIEEITMNFKKGYTQINYTGLGIAVGVLAAVLVVVVIIL